MNARLTALAAAAALALMLLGGASGATTEIAPSIYSIRPDGSARTLLLRLDPPAYLLVRSRDGQKIAFSRDVEVRNLYVSDISSSTKPVEIHPSGYPTFSPDGARLAVSTSTGLYVVNTDDTGLRLIADGGFRPSWSPSGMRMAYETAGPSGSRWDSEIHVASVDGGDDVMIARGLNAEWAPRGDRIAYLGLRGGYAAPCFVDSDGSHRMCYRGFSVNEQIVWSADGKRVAFKQSSNRGRRIAVAAARERHIHRFPILKQRFHVLAWSPDGRWLAYVKAAPRPSRDQIFARPVNRSRGEHRVTSEGGFIWSGEVRWLRGRISYIVYE